MEVRAVGGCSRMSLRKASGPRSRLCFVGLDRVVLMGELVTRHAFALPEALLDELDRRLGGAYAPKPNLGEFIFLVLG